MKITHKSSESNRGVHGAFVLEQNNVDQMVGELLTLIDALGLKEKQEKSLKDLVRQKIWNTVSNAFYINGQVLVLAQDIDWEVRDENSQLAARSTSKEERQKGLHPKWIKGEYELTFIADK